MHYCGDLRDGAAGYASWKQINCLRARGWVVRGAGQALARDGELADMFSRLSGFSGGLLAGFWACRSCECRGPLAERAAATRLRTGQAGSGVGRCRGRRCVEQAARPRPVRACGCRIWQGRLPSWGISFRTKGVKRRRTLHVATRDRSSTVRGIVSAESNHLQSTPISSLPIRIAMARISHFRVFFRGPQHPEQSGSLRQSLRTGLVCLSISHLSSGSPANHHPRAYLVERNEPHVFSY